MTVVLRQPWFAVGPCPCCSHRKCKIAEHWPTRWWHQQHHGVKCWQNVDGDEQQPLMSDASCHSVCNGTPKHTIITGFTPGHIISAVPEAVEPYVLIIGASRSVDMDCNPHTSPARWRLEFGPEWVRHTKENSVAHCGYDAVLRNMLGWYWTIGDWVFMETLALMQTERCWRVPTNNSEVTHVKRLSWDQVLMPWWCSQKNFSLGRIQLQLTAFIQASIKLYSLVIEAQSVNNLPKFTAQQCPARSQTLDLLSASLVLCY